MYDFDAVMKKRIAENEGRQRATAATPPLTIVAFDWTSIADRTTQKYHTHSFLQNVVFMGMLTNMPGHCLVIDHEGKGRWGYHPESFFVLTEEET